MNFKVISADYLDSYVNRSDAIIIDLRSRTQYAQGHIAGAANIPFDELESRLRELPRNETLVFYCQHGSQSLMACRMLSDMGFQTISVTGGLNYYRGNQYTYR